MNNQNKNRIQNPVIVIKPEIKKELDKRKIIPEETYNNVIRRLLKDS